MPLSTILKCHFNTLQKTYYVKEAKTTYYIPPTSKPVTEAPKVKKSISQSIFPQNEIESATDTLIIKELPRKTDAKPLIIKELPKVKWHVCSKIVSLKSLFFIEKAKFKIFLCQCVKQIQVSLLTNKKAATMALL